MQPLEGYSGYEYGQPPVTAQPQQQTNTTIIVNQQQATPQLRAWHTSLFGCFEDIPTCLCGTFLGFCLMCQVSTDMGESACVPCCVPTPLIPLRTKWRTQQNIEGSIMDDCLCVHCCGPCVLCQLAREIKTAKNFR
ncbi:hypothetical protein RRG08_034897 [Elysia crispata]|uniref:Uncharacterized protein n=1 Tax=Elysia crispata TaxID=231223 RepID=A0AAE1AKU4_9GAST|nr:hypothetical protein RRG08_034897 [Elysia crispata]